MFLPLYALRGGHHTATDLLTPLTHPAKSSWYLLQAHRSYCSGSVSHRVESISYALRAWSPRPSNALICFAIPRWRMQVRAGCVSGAYGSAYVWASLQTRMRYARACLKTRPTSLPFPQCRTIRRPGKCLMLNGELEMQMAFGQCQRRGARGWEQELIATA